jgi:hypothetical protein
VVDGASGVSARTLAEGATDAAWLAGTIDGVLRERIGQGDDPDLATLIHDLQADLAERFQAGATGSLENDTMDRRPALLFWKPVRRGTARSRSRAR